MVERWGFEDPACGVKRVSVILVRKGTKKKKEKKNITCIPTNGAMAVVGVGAKGRMQWQRGGLCACRQGCMVIPLVYTMVVVPMQWRWVW